MNQPTLRLLGTALLATIGAITAGCSGAPDDSTPVGTTSSDLVSGNEKAAYQFFVSKGLKPFQAAGIVGNLEQESNVEPTAIEYGGGPGRGIAQWSVGGRWNSSHDDNVVWYAIREGKNEWSLTLQLEFVWYELETFSTYGLGKLRNSTNVSEATIAFEDFFERCGQCEETTRINYAKAVLTAMHGSSGSGGTAADACNKAAGFCTETLQCDNGHWIVRQDDPHACTTIENVQESCDMGGGYCTATLQCEKGHWVPRVDDPAACTSGPGA
ncbi:MAG TPA: phage tail tip lysozyme [Polyangiaceae bacterium]|nr:phage tail tip lysozyme [Polyangiaceae bacterium]